MPASAFHPSPSPPLPSTAAASATHEDEDEDEDESVGSKKRGGKDKDARPAKKSRTTVSLPPYISHGHPSNSAVSMGRARL